jgi:type III secretion protein V
VITAIRRAFAEAGADGAAIVLTQPDIRRFVRKLIDAELPDVTVVSFAELLPEVALRPLARAHLGGIG